MAHVSGLPSGGPAVLLGQDYWGLSVDQMGLNHSGGNLLSNTRGNAFLTSRIILDNTGFTRAMIGELYASYHGLKWLDLFPTFPRKKDATGHVDMWMSLVDENTLFISRFRPDSEPELSRITDQAAEHLMARGFEVFRTPAYLGLDPGGRHAHYTMRCG